MDPKQKMLLKHILKQAQNTKSGLAIFDLDSTLFDVTPRTYNIIKEFAKIKENKINYPEDTKTIEDLSYIPTLFHIKDTINSLNLISEEAKSDLTQFWKQKFFSNHYLNCDILTTGAYEFIRELINHNIEIMYLTGRDQIRMKEGTVKRLKKEGFLQSPIESLMMKPNKNILDSKFKRDIIVSTEASHDITWFFENEPENIHLVSEDAPHVKVIFFDSVHSGKKPLPTLSTPRIKSFSH